MDVLIIKNAPNKEPGNIMAFLISRCFRFEIIEAYKVENKEDFLWKRQETNRMF